MLFFAGALGLSAVDDGQNQEVDPENQDVEQVDDQSPAVQSQNMQNPEEEQNPEMGEGFSPVDNNMNYQNQNADETMEPSHDGALAPDEATDSSYSGQDADVLKLTPQDFEDSQDQENFTAPVSANVVDSSNASQEEEPSDEPGI